MPYRRLLRLAAAVLFCVLPRLHAQQQTPLTTNLLINPGAEAGSIDGWTPTGPGTPTVDTGTFNGGINPHTGGFDFLGQNGASDSLAQTVSLLTQGITSSQLDSGTLYASLSFWEQGLNQGAPSDDAFITLTFLDSDGAALATVNSGEVDSHDGAWSNFSSTFLIPAGTRSITYTMNFVRHAGSDLDGYVDDNSLILSSITQTPLSPTLTWPTPAPIVYGTALSAAQLNASATGVTGAPLPGTFTYTPAAGTVLTAGPQTLSVLFTPSDPTYSSARATVPLSVTQATPGLTWPTPASITYGTALSATQLNASATGTDGTAIPGSFTYTPAAGTVLAAGSQTLRVRFIPTDATDYTSAARTVTLVVTQASPTLNWPTPAPIPAGTALSSTQLNASVIGVSGADLPGTFSYTPASGTVLATGSQTLRVLFTPTDATDYTSATASVTLNVTSTLPTATLTGPSTTPPGSQPSVNLTLGTPYPTALTATATLAFAASVKPAVDDPALQFSAGTRTLVFIIPANSTVIPPILLQAGTVAGTITVSLTLSAGTTSAAATVQPAVIIVPAAVPVVSTLTAARSSNQLSVAIHGFSNTREVTQATFHFVPIPGITLDTPDITAPITPLFTGWYSSTTSTAFGSTFTYTQLFTVSDDPARIASVQVTLTNSVGSSTPKTTQ